MRSFLILAVLIALPAFAQPPRRGGDKPPDPCLPAPQLYIAPMGQAFRAPAGATYPVATWFAGADADRDGRVTLAEFVADAERGFVGFDTDRNGEIEPGELTAYERDIAPEISLYQRGRPLVLPEASGRERRAAMNDGVMGAGRYAQLNVPHPIASADLDFNRGITLGEWRATAARRFAQLGPVDGALTLAGLKPTPVQAFAALCAARAAKAAKKKK